MQNRNVIWVFTVLLTLACIYQLSFSLVTSSVESEAKEFAEEEVLAIHQDSTYVKIGDFKIQVKDDEGNRLESNIDEYKNALIEDFLLKKRNEPVYPVFKHTYKYCKENELARGLDLEGGMSVALEVSIPDMVENLAGRNIRKREFSTAFNAAKEAFSSKDNGKDFIAIFDEKIKELSPKLRLGSILAVKDEDGKKMEKASNEQIIARLSTIAADALDNTEIIINNRINGLGLSQLSVQKNVATGRLQIELPGVKDKKRIRDLLQGTAKLEFWHTYNNTVLGNEVFENVNTLLSNRLFPGYRDSVLKAEDSIANADTTAVDSVNNILEEGEAVAVTNTDTTNSPSDSNSTDSGVANEFNFDSSDFTGVNNNGETDPELEKFRKLYPLSAYLDLNVNGENQWVEGPILGYAKLSDTAQVMNYLSLEYVKKQLRRDLAFMWSASELKDNAGDPYLKENEPLYSLYLVKRERNGEPLLDGGQIEKNGANYDFVQGRSDAKVILRFNSVGSSAWADMTETSANNKTGIAITLDNKVFSAPVAGSKIEGGNTEITGGTFNGPNGITEAKDLANILNAGALPAPAKIVDESVIGPTLGEKNVKSGLMSFVIAILLVLVYMIFYYSKGGMVADIALIANIFFIFGTLASLGAALTLPGIAGIVLTIGMSVDANVLVFERIREEIRKGKSTKASLEVGYSKALSAILDANVTTLLTAIILAYFGSGPIKGFATTLIIGIFTSLFSALVITRLIFSYMMDGKRKISFSTKLTENFLTKANWQFVKRRRVFYVISGLIIAYGAFSLFTKGLDFGVEFTGGRTYKIEFDNEVDIPLLKKTLSAKDAFNSTTEVKSIGTSYQALITTNYLIEDKTAESNNKVEAVLDKALASINYTYDKKNNFESRQVDPGISEDFKTSSIFAIIFSLVVIFLYILLRFRKWQFGFGALLAMFHDVLIVLSLFSIFYGVLPFSMEIDQAFIAAILTVVGYSINDTVVVFDRIREYLTEKRREDSGEVINSALNSTLSRTVNTSVTTFLVLLIIFVFGGESIQGMTFALMIGVIVGTYSSLCIATPSVVDLSRTFDFKKKQKL